MLVFGKERQNQRGRLWKVEERALYILSRDRREVPAGVSPPHFTTSMLGGVRSHGSRSIEVGHICH
jgi:hypothetical protein